MPSICAAPQATQPTTAASADSQLMGQLTEINARAAAITSLSADFEQRKFTALLRKPLVSSGRVRVKSSTMRWDTERPEKSVLLITENQVRIYYPAQAVVEIYNLDQRLAELASSPLPRLAALKNQFAFARVAPAELDPSADPAKFLAIRLTPITDELRQHLQQVRVLLDTSGGYIVYAELTDADGDKTIIHFRNVRVNVGVGDLELKVRPGTKFTHPLEGLASPPGGKSK
ncbi:MAG TPA: outer membrane lipoprotein carrier protein LolA [Tepidisphaeraceae bacterium]|nr:outer membrane lipoprotein carrier protein LolA [Tepidisphaeraceae bacterium]